MRKVTSQPHPVLGIMITPSYLQNQSMVRSQELNTSRLFSHTRLIQVPGCTDTRSADQQICCCPGQSSPAILLSPNKFQFDSEKPVPEAKDLVVTLEKRTISYLCVSARIRVIDPFKQNTTWHWKMQTLRIVLRLNVPSRPSQSFTLSFLREKQWR